MKRNLLFIAMLLFAAVNAIAKEGLYMEFKMTGDRFSGTCKAYSCDGNTRSETKVVSPAMPRPISTVSLALKRNPDSTYMLNEKDKTYSEAKAAKRDQRSGGASYEIKIVGKEKIDNYNCTHVIIKDSSAKMEREIWLTKDIAGWAKYASVKSSFLEGADVFDALKGKGVEGCIVRLLSNSGGGNKIQMDLVKAEKKDVNESLFSLKGYTKTKTGLNIPGMNTAAPRPINPKNKDTKENSKQQH